MLPILLGAAALHLGNLGCVEPDDGSVDDEAVTTTAEASIWSTSARRVTFPGPSGVTLEGVLYAPSVLTPRNHAAVVMMHGCTGMWSGSSYPGAIPTGPFYPVDTVPNLQSHIDKWGYRLAAEGYLALAVDSFSPRGDYDPATARPEPASYQQHCGESDLGMTDPVSPYYVRPLDAEAGKAYLATQPDVDWFNIGLLGWSHGAEAAMTAAARTPNHLDVPKLVVTPPFAATVAFYPGCGANLGFKTGGPIDTSNFWRPLNPLRLNIGALDGNTIPNNPANCSARIDGTRGAATHYATDAAYVEFAGAEHGFDGKTSSQTWPTSTCATANNDCAMRTADLDSLAFFDLNLL